MRLQSAEKTTCRCTRPSARETKDEGAVEAMTKTREVGLASSSVAEVHGIRQLRMCLEELSDRRQRHVDWSAQHLGWSRVSPLRRVIRDERPQKQQSISRGSAWRKNVTV